MKRSTHTRRTHTPTRPRRTSPRRPVRIDPLVVLDAARSHQRNASLCAGGGIRVRCEGDRRISVGVGKRGSVLLRARPQPSRAELAMLHDIAETIRSSYPGHATAVVIDRAA